MLDEDDDELTDEEAAALYAEILADGGPITHEELIIALRQLVAQGEIEFDEANMRIRGTPRTIARYNRRQAKKGLRKRSN